jgi:hypothetical protein
VANRRPNSVVEGARRIVAVLDMVSPRSGVEQQLAVLGTIYVYQIPDTTNLFA